MIEELIKNILYYDLYGEPLKNFLLFILVVLLSYPIIKLLHSINEKYIKKFVEKTEFKYDDILFNSLEPSLDLFILVVSFYVGSLFFTGKIHDAIIKVNDILVIFPLIYFSIKFSTELLRYVLYVKAKKTNKKVNEAALDLIIQVLKISLVLVGILWILQNAGYNISALLAGLGVGGLAFALAAQEMLKNFFAGISLIFDKAFNKGERISFNNYQGIIEEVSLRSTKVRTYDKTLLIIPNSRIAEDVVENVTKAPKVKIKMTIGLTYDTSYEKLIKAKKIIEKAIKREENTDKENYWIWFDNFGDYTLDLKVIYYETVTYNDWDNRVKIKENVNLYIKREFEKAKIDFAFPTQTIELIKKK